MTRATSSAAAKKPKARVSLEKRREIESAFAKRVLAKFNDEQDAWYESYRAIFADDARLEGFAERYGTPIAGGETEVMKLVASGAGRVQRMADGTWRLLTFEQHRLATKHAAGVEPDLAVLIKRVIDGKERV